MTSQWATAKSEINPDSSFSHCSIFGLPFVPVGAVILFEEEFQEVFGLRGLGVLRAAGNLQQRRQFQAVGPIQNIAEQDIQHVRRQMGHSSGRFAAAP